MSMNDNDCASTPPFQIGWSLYRLAGRLGWKDWLRRLDIYRYMEYAGALQRLRLTLGASVLDAGSANSVLPIFLAANRYKVLAIDVDDGRLAEQTRRLPHLEDKLFPAGGLRFEHQDVRALTFTDNSFDAVTAISMIEHIPDEGDMEAVRELGRVVKPGGRLVITVPYGSTYYPGRPPQSTAATQRIYDESALSRRLLETASLVEETRWYIINRGFDFERKIWRRIPISFHHVTGWTALGLVCAQLFFRNSSTMDGPSASAIGLSLVKTKEG